MTAAVRRRTMRQGLETDAALTLAGIGPTPIAEFADWAAAVEVEARNPSGPAVYLVADRNGGPLYVGSTKDVARRLNAHRRRSWWAGRSGWVSFETFSSIDAAQAMECWLTGLLQPLANVHHRNASILLALPDLARAREDMDALDRLLRRYREYRDDPVQLQAVPS